MFLPEYVRDFTSSRRARGDYSVYELACILRFVKMHARRTTLEPGTVLANHSRLHYDWAWIGMEMVTCKPGLTFCALMLPLCMATAR